MGDDALRDAAIAAATAPEQQALINAVSAHTNVTNHWIDSFQEGIMTDEAVVFMYLSLAIEELDLEDD